MITQIPNAPGQSYEEQFVIYSALGEPNIKRETWRLLIRGHVENELELSFEELERLPQVKLTRDFHCVTHWSIKEVAWEGVRFRELTRLVRPRPEANWVMFHCVDGYTTPVPLVDAMAEDSLIALRMNAEPIAVKQGFPARSFIPHLYAWKSAKWLTELEFMENYKDGYWEARGYHRRGNVSDEERFKNRKENGRPSK